MTIAASPLRRCAIDRGARGEMDTGRPHVALGVALTALSAVDCAITRWKLPPVCNCRSLSG
jgi:hypothetical protein